MTDRPITRKRLLAAAGGLALPLALAPLRPWSALVEAAAASPATRFAALLSDRESAAAVGGAYLDAVPGEADPDVLVGLLARSLGRAGRTAGDDALRRLLALRIERDFDEELVQTVAGWVLSRTEARLCALCALATG